MQNLNNNSNNPFSSTNNPFNTPFNSTVNNSTLNNPFSSTVNNPFNSTISNNPINPITNSTINPFNTSNTIVTADKSSTGISSLFNNKNDIETTLNNIYLSYTPGSPLYKFKYTFYNVPKASPEGKSEMQSLIPVELTRDEIVKRKDQQGDLILKLNGAKFCVIKEVELLKNKKEAIKCKLKNLMVKYRRISKQYVINSNLMPVQVEKESITVKRDKFYLIRNTETVDFSVLEELNSKLEKFLRKITEDIKNVDTTLLYNN